ncbi:MAG: endonuclease, partial [Conexibacter sp.]|nr:endonuclease [Conexibacter sp.]
MLREAKNAAWTVTGHWLWRRHVFTCGKLVAARGLRAAEHAELAAEQRESAVEVLRAPGDRTYWWSMDRFFWEDDGLAAPDVFALVYERHVRAQRRLERAHA